MTLGNLGIACKASLSRDSKVYINTSNISTVPVASLLPIDYGLYRIVIMGRQAEQIF
jgi:subtilase family serine protease